MRYILLLMAVAIIYLVIAKSASFMPAKQALTESMHAADPQPSAAAGNSSPHTDALKAPLDRAHAVIDQVNKQNKDNQF